MRKIFVPAPEGVDAKYKTYAKGLSYNSTKMNNGGPIYIENIRHGVTVKTRYALRTLAATVYMFGGAAAYDRIQFVDIAGEGAIRNAVSRAKAYLPQLNVILREQAELFMPSEIAYKIYVKHDAKVNLNVAAFCMVIFARMHALEIRKPDTKDVFNDY